MCPPWLSVMVFAPLFCVCYSPEAPEPIISITVHAHRVASSTAWIRDFSVRSIIGFATLLNIFGSNGSD